MATTDLGIAGLGDGEVVGAGGNAIVYRARQLDLERDVAVKLLRGSHDEDSRRRFERERRAMAALPPHDGIAPVYSSGVTATGEPYLVMPLYTRGSLQQEQQAGSWRAAVTDMVFAADAIVHAHANGVLHRDLKPANLMRTDDGVPVIVDFGIASLIDETQSGALTLTPSYAPPEAFAGDLPDERVDVYGLGATLHSLLSGSDPFDLEEAGVWQAIKRVRSEPPTRLSADVPESVCRIVERAMAKEPNDRYATAALMRDDLQRVLDDRDADIDVPVRFGEPWARSTSPAGDSPRPTLAALATGAVAIVAVAVFFLLGSGGESAVVVDSQPEAATELPAMAGSATAVPDASTPVDSPTSTSAATSTATRATRQEADTEPTALETATPGGPDDGCLAVIEACLGDSLTSVRAIHGLPSSAETYTGTLGDTVASEWRFAEGGSFTVWSVGDRIEQMMIDLSNGIEGTTVDVEPGITLEDTSFAEVIELRGEPYLFHAFEDGTGGTVPFVAYCVGDVSNPYQVQYGALIGTDNEELLGVARAWSLNTKQGLPTESMRAVASPVVVSTVRLRTAAWMSPYPACGGLNEPYSWCPDVDDAINVRAEPRLTAAIVISVGADDCRIYTGTERAPSSINPDLVLSDGLTWMAVVVAVEGGSPIRGWAASPFLRPNEPCAALVVCG